MDRSRFRWLWVCLLALCLGACIDDTVTPRAGAGEDGDAAMFEQRVQPILAKRCSFLGCHGREGMPLTLYAVDYLRLVDPNGLVDPTRPRLDELALTSMEVDLNRGAVAARVTAEDPNGDRFVRRLIPPARGGIRHADVVVYERPDDPELEILRRFLLTVRAP